MIYLDHAATSRPKAPGVAAAIAAWYAEVGVSAERGDGALCARAREVVTRCRTAVGALCGVPADRVAFTSGATESLHLAMQAVLRDGDALITTRTEHSSVARPARARQRAGRGEVTVVDCDAAGQVDPEDFARTLREAPAGGYRLAIVNHASNVTGAVQDAATLCALARDHGAISLIDASQTAGVLPLHDLGADLVACAAHKGLLGPPGLGMLVIRPGLEFEPPKPGGSGSSAALDTHPDRMPTSFEAGTPNTPAIFGLDAALRWRAAPRSDADDLRPLPLDASLAQLDTLIDELRDALPELIVYHPVSGSARLPIVSLTWPDLDPAEAGALLDLAGIHVRTGHHCAPWIHERLGTVESGTLRLSPGPFVSAANLAAVRPALAV